jgi:hypothetical protein
MLYGGECRLWGLSEVEAWGGTVGWLLGESLLVDDV